MPMQNFKWIVPGFVQISLVDIFLFWNWPLEENVAQTYPTRPDEIAVEDGSGAEVFVINEVRVVKEFCHSEPMFWLLASKLAVFAATYT